MRGPMNGETPLSKAEVEVGIAYGIIDTLPIRRRYKAIGEWESRNVEHLAKAHPFDWLMN